MFGLFTWRCTLCYSRELFMSVEEANALLSAQVCASLCRMSWVGRGAVALDMATLVAVAPA